MQSPFEFLTGHPHCGRLERGFLQVLSGLNQPAFDMCLPALLVQENWVDLTCHFCGLNLMSRSPLDILSEGSSGVHTRVVLSVSKLRLGNLP
jgi:hypothetical protein